MAKVVTTVLVCVMSMIGMVLFGVGAHAASPSPPPVSGLTISPLRTEMTMAAGTEQSGTLTLTNNTAAPMTVHMDAERFTVTDKKYDYSFDTKAAVIAWVSFSQDTITITAGKSDKVNYIIGVPVDGDPGSKYLALFATTDAQGSGDVKSQQRVASLVYLSVSGDVTKTGTLVALQTPWLTSSQDQWTMDIRNSGTDYFRSQYGVTVQNLLGGTVGSYKANALILSASVRSVTGILPQPQWPGVYKAVYTATMGDNRAASQTRLFIYMPLWSVGALVVLILMIIGTVFYVRSLGKDDD